MKIDENEVRKTLAIMKPQNTLFEIRIISTGGGNVCGFFSTLPHRGLHPENIRLHYHHPSI